jgi:hypothetical protein
MSEHVPIIASVYDLLRPLGGTHAWLRCGCGTHPKEVRLLKIHQREELVISRFRFGRRIPTILVAGIAAIFAGQGSTRASVLESTATLPLLNFPYTIPGGTCFTTAAFCVSSGASTLTSVTSFTQTGNETIVTEATDTIGLTNLSHQPVGTLSLTGTITQVVLGRANPGFIGTWTVDLTTFDLSGSLNGYTVTVELNPADLALDTGTTSISQSGSDFRISSFFDVYTEITYDGLTAYRSATASVAAPEPTTLALLAGPLLAMGALRRRRE